MRHLVLIALAITACTTGRDQASPGADSAATRDTSAVTPAGGLPAMPQYPVAERGRMVVQSAGPAGTEEIRRDWTAEAGWCESPPMLQVKSEQVGAGGTLVLLALPEERITSYPVKIISEGLPTPPAAQVGVQLFGKTGSFAYQASEGSVDIYAFGRTVSGRFAVTIREINRNILVGYAGTFREIPLVKLDPSLCAPAAGGVAPPPR